MTVTNIGNREHPYADRMSKLAETFPCLRGKPGVRPWRPAQLHQWYGVASSGERGAAGFVLMVWNTYDYAKLFDFAHTMRVWDDANRRAFLSWVANPWWA